MTCRLLGPSKLTALTEAADCVRRNILTPWDFSHHTWTDRMGRQVATFFGLGSRATPLISGLDPQTVNELLRGYYIYKYLRSQHADLVAECECAIGVDR